MHSPIYILPSHDKKWFSLGIGDCRIEEIVERDGEDSWVKMSRLYEGLDMRWREVFWVYIWGTFPYDLSRHEWGDHVHMHISIGEIFWYTPPLQSTLSPQIGILEHAVIPACLAFTEFIWSFVNNTLAIYQQSGVRCVNRWPFLVSPFPRPGIAKFPMSSSARRAKQTIPAS